jgi:Mrp family chromosome partitioning ATPase
MRNQRKRTAAADTAISERENLKTETVVPGISRNLRDHAEPKEKHGTQKKRYFQQKFSWVYLAKIPPHFVTLKFLALPSSLHKGRIHLL